MGPKKFGPQEFGPQSVEICVHFMTGNFVKFLGSKFLWYQISRDHISLGPNKYGPQLRSGTISALAHAWSTGKHSQLYPLGQELSNLVSKVNFLLNKKSFWSRFYCWHFLCNDQFLKTFYFLKCKLQVNPSLTKILFGYIKGQFRLPFLSSSALDMGNFQYSIRLKKFQ